MRHWIFYAVVNFCSRLVGVDCQRRTVRRDYRCKVRAKIICIRHFVGKLVRVSVEQARFRLFVMRFADRECFTRIQSAYEYFIAVFPDCHRARSRRDFILPRRYRNIFRSLNRAFFQLNLVNIAYRQYIFRRVEREWLACLYREFHAFCREFCIFTCLRQCCFYLVFNRHARRRRILIDQC